MKPILEVRPDAPRTLGSYPLHRIQFETHEDALAHRKRVGCGGWILGRFLYPGTGWTPSSVMLDCPDEGVLR